MHPEQHPSERGTIAADGERERLRAFLRLSMSERLRRGVELSRFALRNLGAATGPPHDRDDVVVPDETARLGEQS